MKMNKNIVCLFILIIFYLVIRLTVLYLGTKEIYGGGEIYFGGIAMELIKGPVFPFFDYQLSEYSGDWFVMPFLIVPFFIVLGPTYLSLKLASLLFPLAIFILLYLFLYKFFTQRIALLTGLMLILSPPSYTRTSFFGLGAHMESSLFTIAIMYIFYKMLFYKNQKIIFDYVPKSYFILFGLVSGFGTFFCYTFIITLITIFMLCFIFNKKFFLTKNFLLFVFFFLLGFSPWFYNNIFKLRFAGIDFLKEAFLKSSFDMINIFKFFHRIILLPSFIMQSLYFKDIGLISKGLLSHMYFFIFVISYLTLGWKNRLIIAQFFHRIFSFKEYQINFAHSAKEIFFLIYPLIFLFIFAFSNFSLDKFRYLIPLYPFMFIIISLFIDTLWRRKYKYYRYFAVSIMTILMLIGIIGNLSFISYNGFKRINQYKGFRYYLLGGSLVKRYGFDLDKYINSIKKLDKLAKRDIYRKIAIEISYDLKEEDIEKWLNYVNKIDHSYRPYFYNELGATMMKIFGQDVDKAIYLIDRIEEKYRLFLYKGLMQIVVDKFDGDADKCMEFLYSIGHSYKLNIAHLWYAIIRSKFSELHLFSEDIKRFIKLAEKVPLTYRPYIFTELGKIIGIDFLDDFSTKLKNLDMGKVFAMATLIPEEYRVYLYEGFGEGIVEYDNEFLALDLADQIYPDYRAYAYRGIGKGFAWIYGEDAHIVLKEIDKQLDMKYKPFLYKGIGSINQR